MIDSDWCSIGMPLAIGIPIDMSTDMRAFDSIGLPLALLRVTVGERIENRRVAVGIPSQAELARRAKVPQSTMNGLVRKPYRWSPHMARIARELQTTVDYLAGETDDPDEDAPPAPDLTSDERQLLDFYRRMGPAQRTAWLTIAASMVGEGPIGSVQAPQSGFGEQPR